MDLRACEDAKGTIVTARILPRIDLSKYDRLLLDERQRMRVHPASVLRELPETELAAWCMQRMRYGLVTEELITFLRELQARENIAPEDTIEIGAGMGDLGHLLNVRMTDSAMQTTPDMRLYYGSLGQPIIDPPSDVDRIEAVAAVKKYRPKMVIASWVTQLYRDGDTPKKIGSSIYGVDEEWIVRNVDCYVHIGNSVTHAKQRVGELIHWFVQEPWLVSRAADQSANRICIWKRPCDP